MASARYLPFSEIPIETVNPLLERQLVSAERTMLARILLRKGCVVPLHHHNNEQITYILEGALKFQIYDEPAGNVPAEDPAASGGRAHTAREVLVRAGEVLVIPSNVPHSAVAVEDTVDLDIFTPPRQDWLDGTDAYLRQAKR